MDDTPKEEVSSTTEKVDQDSELNALTTEEMEKMATEDENESSSTTKEADGAGVNEEEVSSTTEKVDQDSEVLALTTEEMEKMAIEDETEKSSTTKEATAEDADDVYGQVHVTETPSLIAEGLKNFEIEINKIASGDKEALEQAQEKCPDLLDDDFKLMFLRCGNFNAQKSAPRYVSYWQKRLEIFGPEKAFLPLTLDGALKDDVSTLSLGVLRLMSTRGLADRSLLFLDPSRLDKTKYTCLSMIRSMWYVFHAAVENVNSQKRGVVALVYPKHLKRRQFDRSLVKMMASSIRNCLPIRLSGIHYVHPPVIFNLIFPIIRFFMGPKIRKRIRLHTGSEEEVFQQLEPFDLKKEKLPSEVGGDIVIDHDKWLEERRSSGL